MAVRRSAKIKDHSVLGLDIGTRFIKVAELRLARGTISIVNAAMRPTPPGVLSNSQILDPVGLGRAVREMLVLNRFTTRKAVVSIAGQSSVVVRPIDLPKMTRKELMQTMKFEVERHIPFAADEVVMDYSPLIEPDDLPEEEGQMKVLLAVAQEELINAYLKMISVAGLQPVAMDVEILAAVRALVDIYQDEGAYEQTVALVDLGACSTDISIITDGNLTFTRSVPIAGDSLTEAIADQLGRSFEEAEELKKEHGRIFIEEGFALGVAAEPAHPLDEPVTPETPAEPAAPESADAGPDQLTSFFSSFGAAPAQPAAPQAPQVPPQSQDTPPAEAPAGGMFSLDDEFDVPGPLTVGGPPAAEPAAPAPSFQLDDDEVDDDVPFPFRIEGEGQSDEPTISVLRLDDDVDDEPATGAPVFQLDDAPAAAPGQVFSLDDDGVDDEPLFLPGDLSQPAAGQAGPVFSLDAEPDVPTFSLGDAEDQEATTSPPAQPAEPAEPEPPAFSLGDAEEPEPPALSLGEAEEPAPPAFTIEPEPPAPSGAAFSDAPPADDGPLFDLSSELEGQLPSYDRPPAAPTEAEPDEELFTLLPPASPAPEVPAADAAAPAFDLDAGDLLPAEPPAAPDQFAAFAAPPPPAPEPEVGALDLDGGALFDEFGVAPALAHHADGDAGDESHSDVFERRVFESMLSTLMEMVTEIRRSLEYYTGREPDHPIARIILFGGTSRLPHIAEFIGQELGLEGVHPVVALLPIGRFQALVLV